MNGIQQPLAQRLQGLRSTLLMGTCLAVALLSGCASIPEDGSTPSVPAPVSATQTIHVAGLYSTHPSLEALITDSPFIIAGRVLEWRFEIMGVEAKFPDGETLPPEPRTVAIVEVTGVFAGALKPGDKIEVYQMGGADEKTVWAYDDVPYLPDHRGQDLVLFLQSFDYPPAKSRPYRVADSHEGIWLTASEHLTVLRGVAFAMLDDPKYDGPISREMPGAPDFPITMTLEELKQAIAKVK